MFPTNINNHQVLHDARQRELEADVQAYRQLKAIEIAEQVSPFRQYIGMMLIELGKKVAQESQQDVRLFLSARQS